MLIMCTLIGLVVLGLFFVVCLFLAIYTAIKERKREYGDGSSGPPTALTFAVGVFIVIWSSVQPLYHNETKPEFKTIVTDSGVLFINSDSHLLIKDVEVYKNPQNYEWVSINEYTLFGVMVTLRNSVELKPGFFSNSNKNTK